MIHLDYTFSQLIASFTKALQADTTLKEWAISEYSKEFEFNLCYDENRELGEKDAPWIVIVPLTWDGGITSDSVNFSFNIEIGIVDSTFEDYDCENIIAMRGFEKVDEVVNVVMNIIETHACTYNAIADGVSTIYNNSEFFPLHVCTMNIDVRVDTVMNATRTLGGN